MNLSVVAAIITIFLSTIHLVDAVAAYVFYKDAVCSNGSYIKGQLYYAYDTYSMKGQGFKVRKYNGPCKYFEGGSTTIPSTAYTLSENSTSTNNDNNSVESGAEDDDENSTQIQQFQDANYQEVARYENSTSSTGYVTLLGVFGAMFSMMALFTSSRALRRLQQKAALIGNAKHSVTDYQGGRVV
eukprot:scaffold4204_cov221-Chaetoceros_neogracile.AAC.2